jgi:hypothetical protein
MIEMKRSISPDKFSSDVKPKFEGSIDTLLPFIAVNPIFTDFVDTQNLFFIGVCCYNYLEGSYEQVQRDTERAEEKFRQHILVNRENIEKFIISPLILGTEPKIPVLFFENPCQNPITTEFEINFNDILTRALAI